MKKCIYPGSFDPFTKGHADIVYRALKSFDRVVIGIGINPSKKYSFSVAERKQMIAESLPNVQSRIEIVEFSQLIADFAYEQNINVIIKGVRSNQDFDYERLLHEVTISQQAGIETHILVANQQLSHISSTAAKEICKYQGLLHEYVTFPVKRKMEMELNGQNIFGITGEIGMGKSFITEQVINYGSLCGFKMMNVDLDVIGHSLYTRTEPVYVNLREQIRDELKLTEVTRKEVGDAVFSDPEKLRKLNELVKNPMLTLIRKQIFGFKGIVILNGALLAESNFLHLCNNRIAVVQSSRQTQEHHLMKRGMSEYQIQRRLNSQWNTQTKINFISSEIKKHNYGKLVVVENNPKVSSTSNVQTILDEIISPNPLTLLELGTRI